ncbi:MAG: AIPR family protein [Candidatus Sulfotelmatobacter sp.]
MEKPDKKPWFRDYLISDAEKRLKTSFGSLSDKIRAVEMTRFYIKNVVSKLTPGLVPEDEQEIDDYIVDGTADGGVDFIYPTEGRVLIVQAKYRSSDKYESAEDLTHFCEAVSRLYETFKKKQKLNRKVTEALIDIDWEGDYFELHFITLAKVSQTLRDRAAKGLASVKGLPDLEDRSELSLFDEQELNIKLREALSAGEILDQFIEIGFAPSPDGVPWIRLESKGGRDLYIGQVSGAQLAEMYRQYKYRLFAMNIRDYVGESTTNKGIVGTAVDLPDEFVFFNNGVSAVATQIEPDEEKQLLRCHRFSIINGAQTVRSLSKAQIKESLPLKDVRVILRVMDFSLSKDTDFLADVTRFNNTQNAVKISDFRSNDPVQKDLHRRFSDLNRAGKPYFYKNKRSRERSANKVPIGMEDLAKTVYAFRYGPDDMAGGTRYLFDVSNKGGYTKVFGEPVSQMKDDEFKLLAGTYFLCDEVHSMWKEKRETDNEEGKNSPGLERRWVVYYAVGELLRMVYGQDEAELDSDLRKLSKPNTWLDDETHTAKKTLIEIFKLAGTALNKAYNQASKNQDFRHRNWFRNPETLADIKAELGVIPEYRGLEGLTLFAARGKAPTGTSR